MREQLLKDPQRLVGRALVAIFRNQTAVEASNNTTALRNGIGFSKPDARIGSLSAKYYLKHGRLEDWQLRIWAQLDEDGNAKIFKYSEQLNRIAQWTQQQKQSSQQLEQESD